MLGLDAIGTSQALLRNQSKMEESVGKKHATRKTAAPKPLKEYHSGRWMTGDIYLGRDKGGSSEQ
jgi:hypothetical protein